MGTGKKWRESDTIRFVSLYEKAECLWNFRHPVYKSRNAREQAIQHIIAEMNMPDFGANEVKNKIKNIRSTYQQEVNKIKRSKLNFSGDILEEYKTNLAWFPIADRFLSAVINSTKLSSVKGESPQELYYQASDSTMYSLVETEMTNANEDEPGNEDEPPFGRERIKEEVNEEEEYPIVESKKRKLSEDYRARTEEGECLQQCTEDEWLHLGKNIACQLRSLPLESALRCQKKITDLLIEERIKCLTKK